MQRVSRRKFLKWSGISALGAAGAALGIRFGAADEARGRPPHTNPHWTTPYGTTSTGGGSVTITGTLGVGNTLHAVLT